MVTYPTHQIIPVRLDELAATFFVRALKFMHSRSLHENFQAA
jgi:hypothetical protein